LWGKQRGGFALLAGHLLDSAAVGEIIWDSYLSRAVREQLDVAADGRGRELLAFLCGIHDIGKAAPSFQKKVPELWEAVKATGLTAPTSVPEAHHSDAGGKIAHSLLTAAGWPEQQTDWVWPLVAGHHGIIRKGVEVYGARNGVNPAAVGWSGEGWTDPGWREAQRLLLEMVARAVGFADLADAQPLAAPTRGLQLVLSGLVIMADWVASGDQCRENAARLEDVSMDASRRRAAAAWGALRLRGGWDLSPERPPDLMRARFGRDARPMQQAVLDVARSMTAPGLIIVEAPMGEGKTEAALSAAETLGHRFGQDGVFVGMPTQATSDPMFERVLGWRDELDPDAPVALSHGRARFNPLWRQLEHGKWGQPDLGDGDGDADTFAAVEQDERAAQQALQWFFGRYRPLLTPVCVGTIDNLLHAATRTRRVSIRFAGLGGKVVVLDEVHSYSVYMQQFLAEALRWLASAGCPVVLLTATLPPNLKADLQGAYLEGATGGPQRVEPSTESAYPLVTWVCVQTGQVPQTVAAASGLPPRHVAVEVLEDQAAGPGQTGDQADLGALIEPVVAAGGRVLVVCNTVGRAQRAYRSLRGRFGEAVDLLHARFTAGDRAERAARVLDRLGPGASQETAPRVIVGTQVLEQSLDIDADLVITDLAPMDLLLQRIGRAHRHQARDAYRPTAAKEPRVVVTGVRFLDTGPEVPYGVNKIYLPSLLFKTAAMVRDAAARGWDLPADIPGLVARAYAEDGVPLPPGWIPAYQVAKKQDDAERRTRKDDAKPFLLGEERSMRSPTLSGLHAGHAGSLDNDDEVAAVVRDGPETVEVLLVRQRDGNLHTLAGRRLTRGGVMVDDDDRAMAIEEAAASVLRLPPTLTEAARELGPEGAFEADLDLAGQRVLPLGEDGTVELGGYEISYDPELGLLVERVARS
jgi:CRISPR-associated endonuclease/helicase Cas3